MEIRDSIHGSIVLDRDEVAIIDSRFFQRLRNIKQLGFAELAFPSASHNRYVHSLGALQVASQVCDTLFSSRKSLDRFKPIVRIAALLHDVGHGPLSHTTEFAMPALQALAVPGQTAPVDRRAHHEDYTLKIILDSSLTPILERVGAPRGFKPQQVAALLTPQREDAPIDDFFMEIHEGRKIDFLPLLRQIISSEMDADRMDYLRRDSFHAGVSYGQFDSHWLIRNLSWHAVDGKAYLGLKHRAIYAFEDFLLSRFHMFLMVYFHSKSVIYDEMLSRYFSSLDCSYALPSDIERYAECDDFHLFNHLAQTQNPWARRIIEKRPYRLLMELHPGLSAIPLMTAPEERLKQAERQLEEAGVRSLVTTSTSALSKQGQQSGASPLFVQYENGLDPVRFIPLEKCTDLFENYRESRKIIRLYVAPEDRQRAQLSLAELTLASAPAGTVHH